MMETDTTKKQIFITISELLAERGLLDYAEMGVMKMIIDRGKMQDAEPFLNGEKIGKSRNL